MIQDKFNRPLQDLRISVTDKCNFRCHYCMPEEIFGHKYEFLAKDKILSFEEITRLVRLFTNLGVKKIRLTGGEPLLRHELERLVEMIAQVDGVQDIALTTNGYFLQQKAKVLKKAGLDRVTVSLDTLDGSLFKKMAGRHLSLDKVMKGIREAVEAGFSPIKINSVIQRGVNDHEILELAKFARRNGFIIRFIEYMDVGNLNGWKMDDVVTAKEIIDIISSEIPVQTIGRNYRSEVSSRYKYVDWEGELGIIASVTQPFCGNCTRIRLSADGKIYTCLFGANGTDLKSALRRGASDVDLLELITSIWHKRMDRYSEGRALQTELPQERKIEMYQIGG